ERDAIEKAYEKQYGTKLDAELQDEMSGDELQKAMHLLHRTDSEKGADDLHKACEGMGTDEAAVYKALDGKTPQQIAEMDDYYKKTYGMSLTDQLKDEMSGDELNKAMKLLHPNDAAKNAADDIYKACEGLGTDEAAIYKALEGKSPEQLRAMDDYYKKTYGVGLADQLKDEMSGDELKKAMDLLSKEAPEGKSGEQGKKEPALQRAADAHPSKGSPEAKSPEKHGDAKAPEKPPEKPEARKEAGDKAAEKPPEKVDEKS